jgi:hypothetical protein
MLAYVFWHWPRNTDDLAAYEAAQREFHAALAESPPDGFLQSTCMRLDKSPSWSGGDPTYEDWYLLESWAALGELNLAAVSGPRARPHDLAAAASGGGAAGVYHLRSPSDPWIDAPAATWSGVRPEGTNVWQRQLVLGPTPEWCGAGATGAISRERIWPPVEAAKRRSAASS